MASPRETLNSEVNKELVVSTEMPTVTITVATNHGLTYTVVVPRDPVSRESKDQASFASCLRESGISKNGKREARHTLAG